MRLIDANVLLSNSKIIETPYKEEGRWWAKYSVDVNDIKEAPTIDAVPAPVHCGECKHAYAGQCACGGICRGYCGLGERKDGAEK